MQISGQSKLDISRYKAVVFDCDGVILDSNSIKANAFYEVAKPYGLEHAQQLLDYHISYGGVSRYKKFEYFFGTILSGMERDDAVKKALCSYGDFVVKLLMECPETVGLREFISIIPRGISRYVVSGGDQMELRKVFHGRGISSNFDEIWGSPDSKHDIFSRELQSGSIQKPCLFIGDTIHDYECSVQFGLDFIFLYNYSDYKDGQTYFLDKDVRIYPNLLSVMNDLER